MKTDSLPQEQLLSTIFEIKRAIAPARERRMIVFSGSQLWCSQRLNQLAISGIFSEPLFITDNNQAGLTAECETLSVISSRKLVHHLGQEYDTLIWDGFASLNPDALGIAAGLLKGGGLFYLFLPAFSDLEAQCDPDYRRMIAPEFSLQDCHTFFMQRLSRCVQSDPANTIFKEHSLPPTAVSLPPRAALPTTLPTDDQRTAIAAICKVATGHRHRPLVVHADRGRGKSSALGLAAAELVNHYGYKIAITAPGQINCQAAFRQYQHAMETIYLSFAQKENPLSYFKFIALDQLLEEAGNYHLIMLDEAAGISSYLLEQLLLLHPRLVFSTTVHGYEGNGQGFSIRFKQLLNQHCKRWHAIELTEPVRWAKADPLENWFSKFLLLKNSQEKILGLNCQAMHLSPPILKTDVCSIHILEQQMLAQNEPLLEAVFSLLVSAHYQTKPSDLRLIQDHPAIQLGIALNTSGKLLGVILILEEGHLNSRNADDIIAGKRRPQGHLFPQALCATSGDRDFLIQRTYRITRIAVEESHRCQGLGSTLLRAAFMLAQQKQIDYLSTSFGLHADLLSFWQNNHFATVKLGYHADGASARQSVMMMQAISAQAQQLQEKTQRLFANHFIFNLSRLYQTLPAKDCLAILRGVKYPQEGINAPSAPHNEALLKAFAFGNRAFEECSQLLFNVVLEKIGHTDWAKLDESMQILLVMRVLQFRDVNTCKTMLGLSGKKEVDKQLRQALQQLMSAGNSQD